MTIVLPIFFLALFCPLLARRLGGGAARQPLGAWAEGLLAAAVLGGLCVAASNEALSPFGALAELPLTIFWCVAILAGWVAGMKFGFARPARPFFAPVAALGRFEKTILTLLAALAALLGVISTIAVPNTYDSLTYHLARVAHWEQNGSIAFYPTAILRQNHQAPFAEWIILQLRILSGSWQGVNLVQWLALAGSMVGVARLAGRLGGSGRARLLAAVFAGTLPMGIIQATSTQNDAIAGFWLVCFVHFGLGALESPSLLRLILMSASLGLALLTKSTLYFFAFPFVLWFGCGFLRRMRLASWKPALAAFGLVLAINGGHYARNIRMNGNPLGPGREEVGKEVFQYGCDIHGVRPALSNLARNLALHLATPWEGWNRGIERAVAAFHHLVGLDPSDPRTTWLHERFAVRYTRDENSAGNQFQLLLLALAAAALFIGLARGRLKPGVVFIYLSCLAGDAVLFCVMLRWQPWHSRLHLPLFMLAAPFAALLADWPPWSRLARPAMALLLAMGWLIAIFNTDRPLTGEWSVLRGSRKDLIDKYYSVAKILPALQVPAAQGCHQVGIVFQGNDTEFILWLVQEEYLGKGARFDHVNVTNASRALAPPIHPQFVIAPGEARRPAVSVDGRPYALAFNNGALSVYKALD